MWRWRLREKSERREWGGREGQVLEKSVSSTGEPSLVQT